jgi:hypothetical protein
MATKRPLGELLVQQNLVDQDTVKAALRIQAGGNRRVGALLVRMGKLSEDQLVEVLATQLDIKIIDVNENFSAEVRRKLPRSLCRKYDVIPLRMKSNNILEVAMSDPSDYQAIDTLERFTGNVIEPLLARQSDIAAGTVKLIPYSLSDFFSWDAEVPFTRIAVAISLFILVVAGVLSYRAIHNAKFGTVSISNDSTIYKNHDLILSFDSKGTVKLLGQGEFAKGAYAVTFKDTNALNSFLDSKRADFSENQLEWLEWVIQKNTPKEE